MIFAYASYVEPNRLITKEVKIEIQAPIDNLVFFTDTHFGANYPQEKAQDIVAKINALEADMVVFGGDLLDSYWQDEDLLDLEALADSLSKIDAKYKIAVWGNHDYGGGAYRHYAKLMEDAGFTLLKQEGLTIEELKLQVTGFDDLQLGTSTIDPDELQAKPGYFNLYVSHEPDLFTEIDVSKADLCLSGHSHGGQIALPFIGSLISNMGARNYSKGVYNIGATKLFVSSGIGTTKLKMRLFNVPEIVNIVFEGE